MYTIYKDPDFVGKQSMFIPTLSMLLDTFLTISNKEDISLICEMGVNEQSKGCSDFYLLPKNILPGERPEKHKLPWVRVVNLDGELRRFSDGQFVGVTVGVEYYRGENDCLNEAKDLCEIYDVAYDIFNHLELPSGQ